MLRSLPPPSDSQIGRDVSTWQLRTWVLRDAWPGSFRSSPRTHKSEESNPQYRRRARIIIRNYRQAGFVRRISSEQSLAVWKTGRSRLPSGPFFVGAAGTSFADLKRRRANAKKVALPLQSGAICEKAPASVVRLGNQVFGPGGTLKIHREQSWCCLKHRMLWRSRMRKQLPKLADAWTSLLVNTRASRAGILAGNKLPMRYQRLVSNFKLCTDMPLASNPRHQPKWFSGYQMIQL